MNQRRSVFLVALLPLLVAGTAVAWVVAQRSAVIAELHLEAVEPVMLAARKSELQSFVNLARSSIQHLVRDGMPDERAQTQALAILRRLEFGHDGYFYVFDFDGNTLLYPRQPHLQGINLMNRVDRHGRRPVQTLIDRARAGGGYVDYEWQRPSTGQIETKLGYVEPIAGWEWVIGTGTFVEEPERARRRIAEATDAALVDTLARIAAVTMLSTLAVVALALVINLRAQQRSDSRLREMARQIVRTQEDERARVARELHDGVSQSLVSVKYTFESALAHARQTQTDPKLTETLAQGTGRLREVLGDVRRISHDLRPALLDDLGLSQALEHLGHEWGERTGVAVRLDLQAQDALPSDVATVLFRVAQEALGNVERHAAANQVVICLRRQALNLLLTIEDDGQGFDVSAALASPRHGLGLTHMRERLETLGGRFEIQSHAGGTTVSAVIPDAALAG